MKIGSDPINQVIEHVCGSVINAIFLGRICQSSPDLDSFMGNFRLKTWDGIENNSKEAGGRDLFKLIRLVQIGDFPAAEDVVDVLQEGFFHHLGVHE